MILEMYELDMKVDERIPGFLLKQVDLLFARRKAMDQSQRITVEQFAAFSLKYPEFVIPAFSLQEEVRVLACAPFPRRHLPPCAAYTLPMF